MKHLIYSFVFALALMLSTSAAQAQEVSLKPGQIKALEQASFETIDGKTVSVSDYKGKTVIIDFWETWCGPCKRIMPVMDKLVRDYPDKVVVLAVSPQFSDNHDDVTNFAKAHDYKFTFAYGHEMANTLGITGIPYKVFIGSDGKFIKAQMGIYGDPKADYNELKSVVMGGGKSK